MADTEQHQHHQGHEGGTNDKQAPASAVAPSPGLDAVKALGGTGDPAAMQVVQIIRSHPSERDEIMTWLHQNRGNAFVQSVTGKMGQVEAALPEGVNLDSVHASMTIPGNRKLSGGLWSGYAVKTRDATQIYVEVTHKGISVRMSPAMYLDLNWPARDAELRGVSLEFGKNEPHVEVEDGGGIGVVPLQGTVRSKIGGMIAQAVKGTKLTTGHYDPTQDPDLAGTMNKVMTGFVHVFEGDDAGEKTEKKPPIGANEMTHINAGATISLDKGASFAEGGSGISIAAHSPISVNVMTGGNAEQMMAGAGKDAQHAASAANIQGVNLETSGLEVVVKGKPVARLESITLNRGGKVTIGSMTPLGKLAEAEKTESGLSALVALLAIASRDPHGLEIANGTYQNAQHPQIVDGISRAMIEQQFTDTLHKMIIQYRGAVPGMDIAAALGIG